MTMALLPTTVIGSYPLPPWLEHARTAAEGGELTPEQLEEAHDWAVRSAILDQEVAGVDVITDGELRRETMVYFFTKRIRGYDNAGRMKPIGNLDPSIQMPDPIIREHVGRGGLGAEMARQFRFLKTYARPGVKVCVTGPHMLAKRAHNEAYPNDRDLVFDLAEVMNAELKELVGAGCDFIQIDEPVWVGWPDEVREWAVEAFNRTVEGVDAKIALHICYGNYKLQQLFTGQYSDLFPAVLGAHASQILLEFGRLGHDMLGLFEQYPTDMELGVGVVDVKDDGVEAVETIAERMRTALRYVPAERVWFTPDCGMKFARRDAAFGKLRALVAARDLVRSEIEGRRAPSGAAAESFPAGIRGQVGAPTGGGT